MITERRTKERSVAKSLSLLMVEDNPGDARLILEILSESQDPMFNIQWVETRSQALESLSKALPDAILLDLTLPDSSWDDTFARIHQKAPRVPVVILTGVSNPTLSTSIIRGGAQDYLVKGEIDHASLVRTVVHAIERQKMQEEVRTLYRRIREYLKQSERLIEFSRKVNTSLNLEQLISLLQSEIPNLFHVEYFSIFLLDDDDRVLNLFAHNHPEWKDLPKPFLVRGGQGPMWKAIAAQQPLRLEPFSESVFAQDHAPRYKNDSAIVIPLTAKNIALGVLNLNNPAPEAFSEDNMGNLARVADHLSLAIYNSILHRHIEEMTVTDELTQTYNRRYLWQALANQIEATKRNAKPFSVLMIDLDHFKKVNDTHGHRAGDLVLRHTAQFIKSRLRRTDFVCRFGGEEFVAVLTNAEGRAAYDLAERLREDFSKEKIKVGEGKEITVTVSIGVAQYALGESISQVLDRADRGLYEAKGQGRNRSVLK